MALFTVDYSKANSTHQVMDGTYEIVIKSAGWNKTSKGTEYISVKTAVRSDVVQAEQGEDIEHPLWKSRPENSKASDIDGVPAWKIQQISKAVQLPEGDAINTLDEWFRAIVDKPARITTKQDDQGRAKVVKVEESLFPDMKVGFTAVASDEELPF